MTKYIWYDNYTKILHIGKRIRIGLGGFTNWRLVYHKNRDCHFTYIRIGKLALRF